MGVMDEKHSGSGRNSTDIRNVEEVQFTDVECPAHTTERRLMTKVDMRVVPFLCIMYLLAFLGELDRETRIDHVTLNGVNLLTSRVPLDRVNIANAKLFGLAADLDLGTGNKYNTALVIFFVPYCIFEVPSNILLKKFKPHVWLSLNMFLFGFTTMMQGLVKNYSGLLATRFFLGLFETGMFPGGEFLIFYYSKSIVRS